MQREKTVIVSLAMLLCGSMAFGQAGDPVVMTVNGKTVLRSEFEYAYQKSNANGVIDRKTVAEYADLFVNYKLKVEAALEARLDTLTSFKQEFAEYRDRQVRSSLVDEADMENEARRLYEQTRQRVDSLGGLVKLRHILLRLGQRAPQSAEVQAKQRIDSIYEALRHGADFATLAKKYSDDRVSAETGGSLPWIQPGQTLPEFELRAYSLQKGQMSEPFLSPAGYHIIILEDRRNFFPYDSLRTDILRYIDQRHLREQLIEARLNEKARETHATPAAVLEQHQKEMESKDPSLKYLIQEYHDGLLLFEIINRVVWDKAARDEAGLAAYFNRNKKKYKWESPRYKGVAYSVKVPEDVKNVAKALKRVPFEQWDEVIEALFNGNGMARVKAKKGLFKQGDNAIVDHKVFKQGRPKPENDYPFTAVYGKKLKAPKTLDDVRQVVIADYQEEQEAQWVATLRTKYPFSIDQTVLATVKEQQ